MTDNAEAQDFAPAPPVSGRPRGFLRRVAYPVVVVIAIAGVIYWLEGRDNGSSSTGEEYGVRDLPAALAGSAKVAAEENALAPDFLLESVSGDEVRLSDYRGRPVVLNFWATWCRPCRKEIPLLVAAQNEYEDEGLVVIGLNLQEGKSLIEPFAEDFGMNFPILIDRDGEVGDRYRLLGLPTTFFIDRDGVIRSIFTGPLEGEANGTAVQSAIGDSDLQRRIEEILGEDPDGSG
jgi:peroxiredoxin